MDRARVVQLQKQIAILRDPASDPGARALAVTNVSAAFRICVDEAATVAAPAARPIRSDQRMFGYGLRHEDASAWDGRSTRSGTITFVDEERIEQYIGQQKWIAYRQRDLNEPGFVLGDQVRIAARDGRLKIEAIGANRLADEPLVDVLPIRSGMVILRTLEFEHAEITSTACTAAKRYAATVNDDGDCITLTCPHGAQLVINAFDVDETQAAVTIVADLVSQPFRAAVRLEVVVASNASDAALEAESALVYCAALFTTRGEAVGIDDTWAIFSAEQLYDLGVRDETRAAAFSIAASAAQSAWPAQTTWLSDRPGVCDELVVYSCRPWRAEFAATFIRRALDAFSDATQRTDDPIIPTQGRLLCADERGAAGFLQLLVSLSYETVELEILFLDASIVDHACRSQIEARTDVATLLGADIVNAIVLSFGNRTADTASERFALEMRRADALATAIAATLARHCDGVASDVSGAFYCADDLLELALQRRGKAASWPARVASVAGNRLESHEPQLV